MEMGGKRVWQQQRQFAAVSWEIHFSPTGSLQQTPYPNHLPVETALLSFRVGMDGRG